jgi:hypothetical protein
VDSTAEDEFRHEIRVVDQDYVVAKGRGARVPFIELSIPSMHLSLAGENFEYKRFVSKFVRMLNER